MRWSHPYLPGILTSILHLPLYSTLIHHRCRVRSFRTFPPRAKGSSFPVTKEQEGKNIVGGRVAEARRSFSPVLTQDALSEGSPKSGFSLTEPRSPKSKIIAVMFSIMNLKRSEKCWGSV